MTVLPKSIGRSGARGSRSREGGGRKSLDFAPLTPIGNSYHGDGNAATSGGKGLFPQRGVYTHGMIQLLRYFLFSSAGKEMVTIPLHGTDFVVLYVLHGRSSVGTMAPWTKLVNSGQNKCTASIMYRYIERRPRRPGFLWPARLVRGGVYTDGPPVLITMDTTYLPINDLAEVGKNYGIFLG